VGVGRLAKKCDINLKIKKNNNANNDGRIETDKFDVNSNCHCIDNKESCFSTTGCHWCSGINI